MMARHRDGLLRCPVRVLPGMSRRALAQPETRLLILMDLIMIYVI
jgi:hypothetical protein